MKLPVLLLTLLLAPVCYSANMAHSHLKHVYDAWHSNPDGIGFLPLALEQYQQAHAETLILQQSNTADAYVKRRLNRLSGLLTGNATTDGADLSSALSGMVKHTALSAMAIDATANVVDYADAIAQCTNNALRYAAEADDRVEALQSKTTLTDADRAELTAATAWIYTGRDLNNDGDIAPDGQECGLRQADVLMGALKHLEGLN
ncbi:hypothetical protein [Reinekea blandensis]|uniref:Uncharacterized protein n=1 Tax=Reinekea blandensis MED297 TaxID=314283 RepID=A4BF08_9GAMM|nr:hypothetical protein [Reinekea blandensis]EAR09343.1 hypothetical protein MED297_18683 [Reinekea sp. MED297] [Reinekea blandensis MED297]